MIVLKWNSARPFQCFKLSQATISLPRSTRRVSVGPLKLLEKYENVQQEFFELYVWYATIEKDLSCGRFCMRYVSKKGLQFADELHLEL